MSSKETTLHSGKKIIAFFEQHPELSFNQMNEIVHTFAGGHFVAIVFKPNKSTTPLDNDRPKRDLLEWLKKNAEALDKGEAAHFFTSTFPKK